MSWWITAAGFAAIWGWLMLVATTPTIAAVTVALVFAACAVAVVRYGSLEITVDASGLRAGRAFLESPYVGQADALDAPAYRKRLGPDADYRAYLVTRPYIGHGVMVAVDDPSDPAPYWLISSRNPKALAEALAQLSNGATSHG